jgi:hypothetical protein
MINTSNFKKLYKKYNNKTPNILKEKLESLSYKFMEPFGYLYVFQLEEDLEIEILKENMGPAGESCRYIPCFNIQRTIREFGIEDIIVEIFIQLDYLSGLKFIKKYKVDAKCLYKNRNNPNFQPKDCIKNSSSH